jgi:hypothetical protein
MTDSATVYLQRLLEDSHVVELRTKTPDGWRSRLYTALEPLQDAIRRESEGYTCYTTLNRPAGSPAVHRALRDDDMGTITRVVFDLDPTRPANTPSTDAELQAAIQVRDELAHLLRASGWPTPALGISGNGAHLVYRANLKNTPAWRKAAAGLYMALRAQLADTCRETGVTFDTSVRNPARIWRIYGTVNRKGEATPGRPHRRAEIILPASGWQPVKAQTILRTLETWTPVVQERVARPAVQFSGKGDYSTLDAVRWFDAHGHYRRPLGDGKHAVVCPWEHEHSQKGDARDTSTVLWETSTAGWPSFHCSHAHCDGRRLPDVLALWGDADQFCTQAWGVRHG